MTEAKGKRRAAGRVIMKEDLKKIDPNAKRFYSPDSFDLEKIRKDQEERRKKKTAAAEPEKQPNADKGGQAQ